jgi:hypothetical protein
MPRLILTSVTRAGVPLLVVLLLVTVRLTARQVTQNSPAAPRFGVRTEAVLVDVSVTDHRGRPITDLTERDFQVFEDGVLQKVLTFAHHHPDPGPTAADPARSTTPGSAAISGGPGAGPISRGPTVVALAFDRLSPDGRLLAVKAARAFIEEKQPDEFAGVFIVDQALGVVRQASLILIDSPATAELANVALVSLLGKGDATHNSGCRR